MCFLALLYKTIPDYSVVAAANRDECRDRAGTPPQQIAPGVWAGVDPRAGGTWLGITSRGLLAAVTNFSPGARPVPAARSRGLLCVDALRAARADTVPELVRASLARHAYNDFNLLAADRFSAWAATFAGGRLEVRQLAAGVHVVGNGRPDDAGDPKVARALSLIGAPGDIEQAMRVLPDVLRDGGAGPNGPDAICVEGDTYGTLCSTIIAIHDRDPRGGYYLFADGSPRDCDYADLSDSLRRADGPTECQKS